MQIGVSSKIDNLDRGVIGLYIRWLRLGATQTFSFFTALLAGLLLACGASWAAPTQTVLHSFTDPDGSNPEARLMQASDGNFYGTTAFGGTVPTGAAIGTIFKMTPSGIVTTLHSFAGNGTEGGIPSTGVVEASDGNFYGTIGFGGANGLGYVYKLTPAGVFSTLFSFSSTDGPGPKGELILGADGNLYGTTGYVAGSCFNLTIPKPAPGCGTVFKISLAGVFSTVYTFVTNTISTPAPDGNRPGAVLLLGIGGNIYGTTEGLAVGLATVFKITPAGVLSTLRRLGGAGGAGHFPFGGLVQTTDGTLYGLRETADGAGSPGTLFKLAPDGTGYADLHTFDVEDAVGKTKYPTRQLFLGNDGNVYGTTPSAGGAGPLLPPNRGSIFQVTPAGVFSRIFIFSQKFASGATVAPNGANPTAGLVQGSDGAFYGTTRCGGAGGLGGSCGTVFKLDAGLLLSSPTAAIALDRTTITLGSSATLTWSSSNVTSCAASNDWTGSQPASGAQTVTPAAVGTFTYTLTCSGSGGSANGTATLTVTPVGAGAPGVSIALDKTSITLGSSATLTWSSSNVTSCAASNAWNGSQLTSGTQTVTPAAIGTFTYTLTCSGSGGSANDTATLTVTAVGGGGGSGSSGGGGGGCVMNPNRGFDAMLPLLLLLAMGWIARRRVS